MAVYVCRVQCMKLGCTEVLLRYMIRPLCIRTCATISVGSIFSDSLCTLCSIYMDQNCFCFVTELNKVLVVAIQLACFSNE
jgi:hypothetical protein